MIEKVVFDYLVSKFEKDGIGVYMQEPENKNPSNTPKKFVVIEKTGSGLTNHIHTAMFAIDSYAGSLFEAAELNEVVKQYMQDMDNDNVVIRSRLNSDFNHTDTSTKQPIYEAVFDITHY